MKLLLLKDSRIRHNAGETVEVSPAEAGFLLSTGCAVPAPAAGRENPEMITAETTETPEKPAKTARKTTKK